MTSSRPDERCGAAVVGRWIEVDGRRMHARAAGAPVPDRPPVVLIHGLSISSRYFVPTLRCLGEHLQAVALDLPGFGRSAGPPRALDVPGMADAVIAWLDAAGIGRAVLLGNSLGSQVAVDAAARYPERIAGLVLTGLWLGGAGSRFPVLVHLWQALRDIPREPLTLWPLHAIDFVAAGPRRVLATYRHALADRMEPKLPGIVAPVLIVVGGHDPFAPRWWIEEVARRLPSAGLVLVPEATHAIGMSRPAELTDLVREFVYRVVSAER